VGVWVGNFSGIGVAELSGANVATPLLFKIFNTIDYNNDGEWFSSPEDVQVRQVCGETGLIPGDHCTNIVMDQFIPLVSPTTTCNHMQEIMISGDEKISYCKSCVPESGYKKKLYKIVEQDMQAWIASSGNIYEKIPEHSAGCEKIFKGSGPMITSPTNGTEYMTNKKNPEPLELVCKTANEVSKVFWYVDNKFYKASDAAEKQFFVPPEGPVKVSCTDDKGRNRDIWIKVKYVNL